MTDVTVAEAAAAKMLTRAWRVAAAVPDPELPMVTIADLGILREISADGGHLTVWLTPTYSGCPATAEIRRDVAARLAAAGFGDAEVRTQLTPPWSTDLISADGRRKLAAAGIAPPRSVRPASPGGPGSPRETEGPVPLTLLAPGPPLTCPRCGSAKTERTAAFGAAACRDLHRCRACGESFEHVKEI